MPDRSFDDVVGKMPNYLKALQGCEPYVPDEHGNLRCKGAALPMKKGVYCFYEGDEPLYVGRTDNIRKRVGQHRRLGGGQNQAAFAFNIAKKEFEKAHPDVNTDNLTRKKLAENSTFDSLFVEAKQRVRRMTIRFVEIEDSIEQTLFEVCAHMGLGTSPRFNSFDNH